MLLLLPLLLGMVAVLHLAATRPPQPASARQFLQHLRASGSASWWWRP